MKRNFFSQQFCAIFCIFTFSALIVFSQNNSSPKGAITNEMLSDFQQKMERDDRGSVLINAATQNKLSELALNHELINTHDDHYTNKLKTGAVTNQKSSGRCWLFAGFNILRPAIIKKHNLKDFEFSENYSFFWDKLEKANLFLEGIIETRAQKLDSRLVVELLKNPFPDGGQWHMVVDLIEKYGAVPKTVMSETTHTSSTGEINKLISRKLRKNATILRSMHIKGSTVEELRKCKATMLSEIYRFLCYNFGKPPTSFKWRFQNKDNKLSEWKEYTPKQFYKEFVGVDLSGYICIYNCPAHEYGKLYQIRFNRNLFDRANMTFINLEIESVKKFALKQLLAGEPVWFGCDVGKEFHRETGTLRINTFDYNSLLGTDFSMTKKEIVLYRESIPTHAMVFQGVDIKFGKPVKWQVENSWGKDRGKNGYLSMYDTWFDKYLYSVIINKKYLPKDALNILNQKPVILPLWDPMFSIVRWN